MANSINKTGIYPGLEMDRTKKRIETLIYKKLSKYHFFTFIDISIENQSKQGVSLSQKYKAFTYKGKIYPVDLINSPIEHIIDLHPSLHERADKAIKDYNLMLTQQAYIKAYLAELISKVGSEYFYRSLIYALPPSTHSAITESLNTVGKKLLDLVPLDNKESMQMIDVINKKHEYAIQLIDQQEIIDLIT